MLNTEPSSCSGGPESGEVVDSLIAWGRLELEGLRLIEPGVEPGREAMALLAHVLQRSRSALLARPNAPVDPVVAARYRGLLRRRGAGEPLAYLTGHREFWSLDFEVDRHTLIPRPETELVVEVALALAGPTWSTSASPSQVVDLGTGCGCIAVALAHERPQWRLTAVDVNRQALAVARRNATRHGVSNLSLVQTDWGRPLASGRFDLAVSNPPYVAVASPDVGPSARFEPGLALWAGREGLDAIHTLVAQSLRLLRPGGQLVLEHGFDQREPVTRALTHHGYADVQIHEDLAGHARVASARRA